MPDTAVVVDVTEYAAQGLRVDSHLDAVALPDRFVYPMIQRGGKVEKCSIPYHTFPFWPTLGAVETLRDQIANESGGGVKSITVAMHSEARGLGNAGFFVVIEGDQSTIEIPAGVSIFNRWLKKDDWLLQIKGDLARAGAL